MPTVGAYLLPASYTQRRIFEHVQGQPYADTLSRAWRLLGPLDIAALQHALVSVAERHETLRTALVRVEDRVMQRVVDDATATRAEILAIGNGRELTRVVLGAAEAPFDIGTASLVRVLLLRIGRDDHVLVVVAGHAVWDAISTTIFARDVFSLYAEQVHKVPALLPSLRVQYGDLVAADAVSLDPGPAAHWAQRLEGASLLAPDQLSRGRTNREPAVAWARHDGPSATSVERLTSLARHEQSTLGLTLLVAYAAVLGLRCEVTRLTIALLHANRDTPDWRPLIGYCVDAVLVPFMLTRERSFREHLRETTRQVFENYRWRVPIGSQVRLLQTGDDRPARESPAMHELIFNPLPGIRSPTERAPELPGLRVRMLRTPKRGYSEHAAWPRATLLTTVAPTPAGSLGIDAEFDPHVVTRALVRDVARTFTAFLELAGAQPDAPLLRLGALSQRRAELLANAAPSRARRGWSSA